ncbi:unnamed protein product [Fusarium venenatum]|uniref:Uncharacterized protein n=2 Tax=Fusarium venenatum TaxID=56646 RepID=A0A2L2T7M2_9HYPO|nr:uncharacterized protein FVRRES_03364 [Fusarium venenatum]CEI66852.1 unnamed protein product [Fusarium venenatum]
MKSQQRMEPENTVEIVVLGASVSGKKSFIRRYCEEVFTDRYDAIAEASGDSRLANIAGLQTLIKLKRIPSTLINSTPESCRLAAEADALIMLYEGSSSESLEELRRMRLQVLAPYLEEVAPPTAVVAGKADGAEAAGQAWERGIEEGSELAVLLDAKFGVASALWGDGVKDVVEELAARVLENKGVNKEALMGAGS